MRLLWLLKVTLKGDHAWDEGRRWLDRLNLIALLFTEQAACVARGYLFWSLSEDVGGRQWVTPVAFDLRFEEEFEELKEAVIRFDEAEPMPDEPINESVRRIKVQIEENSVQWLREFRYEAAVDGTARE